MVGAVHDALLVPNVNGTSCALHGPRVRGAYIHRMSEQQSRPFPWFAMVFMVFLLLVLAGMIAIAYSPLIANLFRNDPPVEARPHSHEESVPGAPAPDNTITDAPVEPPPNTPGPDNTLTGAPQPTDPNAPAPTPPPSDQPPPTP